jgi:hypothetical protein
MSFLRRWFWPRSARSDALALYKEGMACAANEDSKGAMLAYAQAIERHDSPNDIKAMALYNRALLLATGGKTERALADLQAVMEMSIPLHGVKLAAKRRLERLEKRRDAALRPNPRTR